MSTPQVDYRDLSESETDLLRLIGEGFSAKEIGERLNISEPSIIQQRETIKQKLQVKNTAGLVIAAGRMGLVITD